MLRMLKLLKINQVRRFFGVEKISKFVSNQINKDLGLYSYATRGNQAHSGIERDWINSGSSDVRLERCAWLAKNKHNYSAEAVKATEKAWGCRHSRVSKDKKKNDLRYSNRSGNSCL